MIASSWVRQTLAAVLLSLAVGFNGGWAGAQTQSDATVRPLIPSVIALRRPVEATAITFNLDATNYPPKTFPAQYLAPPQLFSVFSSASTPWTVQMEVQAQPDTAGRVIPGKQLSFRVNDGPWIPVTGGPQVVMSSVGPTPNWAPLKVEFALDLQGGEYGGEYAFDVAFTAIVLP